MNTRISGKWIRGLRIVGLVFLLGGCAVKSAPESPQVAPGWTAIVSHENGHFGYVLRHEGKVRIRQPYLPAISGNIPFPDSLSAVRVANLMLQKINQGQFPPAVTVSEVEAALNKARD